MEMDQQYGQSLCHPRKPPGLKWNKKTEHLDHHVSLTKEMNALLRQAKEMHRHLPYVFGPVREHISYPHLDPESRGT